MTDLSVITTSLSSISASQPLLILLKDLHTQALTEPPYLSTDTQPASIALTKFVALEPDKCALVYLLLRATGARYIVEAGTSFGVSTMYLALAAGQNAALAGGGGTGSEARVIATENEPVKAERARAHWRAAGAEVEPWIDLRVGDIRETLKSDLPDQIDFLLLDIWSYLALPTLELVRPRLRAGAMIVVDNVVAAAEGYRDLDAYLNDPKNGFRNTVVPYPGGLRIVVYVGAEGA